LSNLSKKTYSVKKTSSDHVVLLSSKQSYIYRAHPVVISVYIL